MKNGLTGEGLTTGSNPWKHSRGIAAVVAIAALYFGRSILIPVAFAFTLAFLIAPLVTLLQKLRIGRTLAVLTTMLLTVALIGSIGWVILIQLVGVAQELPQYRENVHAKISAFQVSSEGQLGRAAKSVQDLVSDLTSGGTPPGSPASGKRPAAPLSVRVVPAPGNRWETVRDLGGPVLEPLARLGMVLIFTIFMLLQREDLRNRLLRLAGLGQLNRMTQVLDEASQRISRYLLMQFLVNAAFGAVFGLGLYFIGAPYPALWGAVAGILRIIPYVGAPAAALLPFTLSFAVSDGWHQPLMVILLIAVLELVTGNFIEPYLYGTRVGTSSLALLVSSFFWAVLWGPAGLILSTPLTVCLVVLGRYIPQLSFLHVLLGDEPPLAANALIYQRLLAMDQQEAHAIVTEFLATRPLVELYDTVLIPALSLAEQDRHKGDIDAAREEFLFLSVNEMLAELAEFDPPEAASSVASGPAPRVICLPAHDQADEITAAMLAQVLEKSGFATLTFPKTDSSVLDVLAALKLGPSDTICISALPPYAFAPARSLCRKVRERFPGVKVLVCVWTFAGDTGKALARFERTQPDQLCTSLAGTLETVMGLSSWSADPLVETSKG